ncbi:uncharacterized protein LOC128249544 [Octopus bimaculoides]|uniref:uncharacterized protein LOC128249544 n=1 Tax=Octopus bimaculoides TaxID=37653 RepID=UPI0022E9631C|nr:uncharacterized protein LOC128249544 [Octopus bimaculoides]
MKECEKLLAKVGDTLKLTPPVELISGVRKITVVFKTMKIATRKIELATVEEIEECLKSIRKQTTFVTRGRTYATVEVRFATEVEAIKNSTEAIRSEEWVLLPSYCGKRVARVRVGKVLPELEEAWLMTATVNVCIRMYTVMFVFFDFIKNRMNLY